MKNLLILAVVATAAFLASCAELQGISGRVVTKEGEFVIQPDGRIEIVVDARSGK